MEPFTLFGRLPKKIRIAIWRASVPAFAPCTFTITWSLELTSIEQPGGRARTGRICYITPTLETQDRISAIRALLLTNKECKHEIERLYPQLLPLEHGAMRWNPVTDIFMSDPSEPLHFLQESSTSDFVHLDFHQDWNRFVWNFGCCGERLKEIHRVPMDKFGPYARVQELRTDHSVESILLGGDPLAPSMSADKSKQVSTYFDNVKISRSWASFLIHIAVFPNLRSFVIVIPGLCPTEHWKTKGGSSNDDIPVLSGTLRRIPGLFAWYPDWCQVLKWYINGRYNHSKIFATNFEWFYEEIRNRLRFFCSITGRNDLLWRGKSIARAIRRHVPHEQLLKLEVLPIHILVEIDGDLSGLIDAW